MNEPAGRPQSRGGVLDYLRGRLALFRDDLVVAALILVVLLIFLLPAMIVTIPAGHVGVLWKRFGGGTVLTDMLSEGTSIILPWDHVTAYDARVQSLSREFEVLSSDGLTLKVELAWRYRVNPDTVGRLHQYAGPNFQETLLAPTVGARARDVFAVYRPEEIYTAHRLEIQDQITNSVRYDLIHRFNPKGADEELEWMVVEDVLVKRIALPPGVEEAIVRKNMARHEVEQYALIVERETKETERKRIEANGIRNFQEIVSGGMTEAYLRWRGIEATLELARSNNSKIVVVGNNKTGGLPILSFSADSKSDGTENTSSSRGAPLGATSPHSAKLSQSKPAVAASAPAASAARAAASQPRPGSSSEQRGAAEAPEQPSTAAR